MRVTASDRTDTVVLVEPIDHAEPSHVKVANKTKVDFAGGQLSVKTTVSGDKNGSVAITIDLPAGSSLVSYLAHSTVHADGSFGECELHMASGRVQLDRINALQANIAAGEVTIGHIAERATIDGAAFALRIGEVEAPSSSPARAGRPGSATPRPTSISPAAAAVSTSTAPTAASPPRPPAAPSGSAG